MTGKTLEQRVQELEAIEEIRSLKARYFYACDRKDPNGVRACFADGPVYIDYGAIGTFDSADALVKVFTEMACHDHMVEFHHGMSPHIEIVDATRALGSWKLEYQLINTQDNTLTQLSGDYEDEYKYGEKGWRISKTQFAVRSSLVLNLGGEAVKAVIAGRPPAA